MNDQTASKAEGLGTTEPPKQGEPVGVAANFMDFSKALGELKIGGRLARRGWNGPGQFVQMQLPDSHSKMKLPYLYIHTTQGQLVPWVASHTDILADDWYIVR